MWQDFVKIINLRIYLRLCKLIYKQICPRQNEFESFSASELDKSDWNYLNKLTVDYRV